MSIVYKQKVIECLRDLSDEKFQRRVWLASSGPEVSSFTEAICGLFNDSGLDIDLDKGKIVFTKEIDDQLRILGQAVQRIDHFQSPANLIIDPHMAFVRELAAKLLEKMNP